MRIHKTMSKAVFLSAICVSMNSLAQSLPVATQQVQLSAFATTTQLLTGLGGGRNSAVTAGADISSVGLRRIRSVMEIRGSYPIVDGNVNRQKSFVAGPVIEYSVNRVRPYVDFLIGRGAITYLGDGYILGNQKYLSSSTLVYSPGVGLDYTVTHHLAVRADLQYQHWNVPAVSSGNIHPEVISIGGSYMFDFNPHHNRVR